MDMDRRALLVFNRLRPIYLFRDLNDEQLVEVTKQFERETFESGQVICPHGEAGESFYVIDKGRARLSQPDRRRQQTIDAGDFFGMEALLTGLHPYAVTALGEVHVLRLNRDAFDLLVQEFPHLKAGLELMARTRRWVFEQPWEWLNASENVYLITRRHVWLLWQTIFLPIIALLLALGLAAGTYYFLGPGWAIWAAALLGVPALAWVAWVYVDWGNDYYIVTNQRVVYVEKVILIYDSRTTLAVGALTAVAAHTEGVTDRLLEYGDVTVKTLSKPLVMRAVIYPQVVAALIEEVIQRTRSRTRESDLTALKSAIRDRIAPPLSEPVPVKLRPELPRLTMTQQIRQFFSFQLRFDQGDTIIYRKHWWILLRDLGLPSVLALLDVGLLGLALAGFLPPLVTPAIAALVGLVLFIPCALWWLYEFQDWRNDLYQVTPDQIIDIYRKPLGQETRDSASLENIQGLHSERPSLLGRVLNFGNVRATIPGKEFTFDDVYDPPGVQEDIQRRIEALRARKTKTEASRRREELAEVLSAYYLATKEVEKNEANQKGT